VFEANRYGLAGNHQPSLQGRLPWRVHHPDKLATHRTGHTRRHLNTAGQRVLGTGISVKPAVGRTDHAPVVQTADKETFGARDHLEAGA